MKGQKESKMIKNLKNNFRSKLDNVMSDKRLGAMLANYNKKILESIMSESGGNVIIRIKDVHTEKVQEFIEQQIATLTKNFTT